MMRKLFVLITAFLLIFALQSYGQQGNRPLHPWDKVTPQKKSKTRAVTTRSNVKRSVKAKPQANSTEPLLVRKSDDTLYDFDFDRKTQDILDRDGSTWGNPESGERIELVYKREENRIKALTATLLNGRNVAQEVALRTENDCWEELVKSFSDVLSNTRDLNEFCGAGGIDFERYVSLYLTFYRRACLEDDAVIFSGQADDLMSTALPEEDASKLLAYANTAISQFDYEKLDNDRKEMIREGSYGDKTYKYKETYEQLKQNVTEFKNNVKSWLDARKNVAKCLSDGYSLFYDSDTYKVINSLTERSKYNFLPIWIDLNNESILASADNEEAKEDASEIFDKVDDQPSFPGGQGALFRWLGDNLRYPVVAQENGIQGKVQVQFVVGKDGSISNVKVVRGVDPSLDKEAVRVVSSMPHWTPGRLNGTSVNVRYTMPVVFRLQ